MRIRTPGEVATLTQNKYLGVLVAARFARFVNALSSAYCKAFGIVTLESAGAFGPAPAGEVPTIPQGRVPG